MQLFVFSIILIAMLVLYFFKPKIDKSKFKMQPQQPITQEPSGIQSPFSPDSSFGKDSQPFDSGFGGGSQGSSGGYTDINDL